MERETDVRREAVAALAEVEHAIGPDSVTRACDHSADALPECGWRAEAAFVYLDRHPALAARVAAALSPSPTREAPCSRCGSDWHYTDEHNDDGDLPVGAWLAAALEAANIQCDSGEDVDRLIAELAARGYEVRSLSTPSPAEPSPAEGLISIAAQMLRMENGCESGHRAGRWHMHEGPFRDLGMQVRAHALAVLAALRPEREEAGRWGPAFGDKSACCSECKPDDHCWTHHERALTAEPSPAGGPLTHDGPCEHGVPCPQRRVCVLSVGHQGLHKGIDNSEWSWFETTDHWSPSIESRLALTAEPDRPSDLDAALEWLSTDMEAAAKGVVEVDLPRWRATLAEVRAALDTEAQR